MFFHQPAGLKNPFLSLVVFCLLVVLFTSTASAGQYSINGSTTPAWINTSKTNTTENYGSHGIEIGVWASNFNDGNIDELTTNGGTQSNVNNKFRMISTAGDINAKITNFTYTGNVVITGIVNVTTDEAVGDGWWDQAFVWSRTTMDTTADIGGTYQLNSNQWAIVLNDTVAAILGGTRTKNVTTRIWLYRNATRYRYINEYDNVNLILASTVRFSSLYFMASSNPTLTQYWDDVRIIPLISNVMTPISTGNVTVWYDSGSGNEIYKIDVNVTTPTNTNYTVNLYNNVTGAFVEILGTGLTRNQSLTITSPLQDVKINVTLNGNQTATPELMQITFFDQAVSGGATSYIPPNATSLAQTNSSSGFWINYTWTNGTGNITNSYNVSVNGTWDNSTYTSSHNWSNGTVAPHGWRNITVWAYNSSGTGSLSNSSINLSTQIQNNAPTILVSNQTVDEGQNVFIQINSTDIDNDLLTYSINRTDLFTDFNISTGKGNWTTNYTSSGVYYFNASVQDDYSEIVNYTFKITVNDLPNYLTSCGELSIEGMTYTLTQNVTSEGTCFTIAANNITLNGAGYNIYYSSTSDGYGINNTNFNNITIKNIIIIQNSSNPHRDGISLINVTNSTITNSTITTSGHDASPIRLTSSNNNIVSNNTLISTGQHTSGSETLTSSNNNTISSNNITCSGSDRDCVSLENSSLNLLQNNSINTTGGYSVGIRLSGQSNSNILTNNFVLSGATGATGVYLFNSGNNRFSGGSIYSPNGNDYYLNNVPGNNTFNNTNFTTRKINFDSIGSQVAHFNYSNNSNIWLNTNISDYGVITRTLSNWTQSNLTWSDNVTTGTITAHYNVTGLNANTSYDVFNNSVIDYIITSDANGSLIPFKINLTTDITTIKIIISNIILEDQFVPPIPINFNSTQGNFWINYTWQAGSGNITNSYNVSVNGTWDNSTYTSSHNWSNGTVNPHGWRNISVYAFNNSGNGSLNLTAVSNNTQIINNPPVLSEISNRTLFVGQYLNISLLGTDVDSDNITYAKNASSKGTLINNNFSLYGITGDIGIHTIIFNVTDNFSAVDTETVTVTITNASSCPSRCLYVKSSGGNNGNTGLSLSQAWATPSYAATQAIAGDIIYLLNGTWNNEHVVFSNSGNVTHRITMTAYNGTPHLNGGDRSITGGFGITMNGNSYITISNITVYNYETTIKMEGGGANAGSHNNISNVTLYNSAGVLIEMASYGSHNNILENSVIHDCGLSFAVYGSCIGISGPRDTGIEGDINYTTNNITIRNVTMWNSDTHSSVDIFGQINDTLIENNNFSNSWGNDVYVHAYGGTPPAIRYDNWHGLTIRNNYFNNGGKSGSATGYIDLCSEHSSNLEQYQTYELLIENNTFVNPITDLGDIFLCSVVNATIQNNIYDGVVGVPAIIVSSNNINITFKNETYPENVYIFSTAGDQVTPNNFTIQDMKNKSDDVLVFSPDWGGGTVDFKFTDNKIFTLTETSGAADSIRAPRQYPIISNATVSSKTSWSNITITAYNITAKPNSSYLTISSITENNATDTYQFTTVPASGTPSVVVSAKVKNSSKKYDLYRAGTKINSATSDENKLVTFSSFVNTGNQSIKINYSSNQAVWGNTSYNYRADYSITNGQRPYVFILNISNTTGTNNLTHIYFNGHVRVGYLDVFVMLDNTTTLPYYIENNELYINATDNGTINIYYGNSTVSSLSNGTTTFNFFDDAETGTFDDKWTKVSGTSGSYESTDKYLGSQSVYVTGVIQIIAATGQNYTNATFEAWMKDSSACSSFRSTFLSARASTSAATFYIFELRTDSPVVEVMYRAIAGTYTLIGVGDHAYDTTCTNWNLLSQKINGTSITAQVNHITHQTATDSNIASGSIGIRTASVAGSTVWADNFRIYPFNSSNPGFNSAGTEQSQTPESTYEPPTPINCISVNGTTFINVSCSTGTGNFTDQMNFNNVNLSTWQNSSSFFWNNTGLTSNTLYIYRIFAKNNSGGGTINLTYATVTNTTQLINATQVTTCQVISSSGSYLLINNITNSGSTACINIQVSNVNFNGAGYIIDGIDTNPSYGILVDIDELQNITISNVTLTDWRFGTYTHNSNYINISNTTVYSNSYGIYFWGYPLYTRYGNIYNNTIYSNTWGMFLDPYSDYFNIHNNIIYSNTNNLLIEWASNNNINNNTIYGASDTGLYLYYDANNNNIIDNTIYSNNIGIRVYSRSNNNIIRNTNIYSNILYDYYIRNNSVNTTFSNTNFSDSRKIYINDTTSEYIYSNLSISISTKIASATAVVTNRSILNWTQSNITIQENWTMNKVINYNISGLKVSTNYSIIQDGVLFGYNNSNGAGLLPQQNISYIANTSSQLTILVSSPTEQFVNRAQQWTII